MIKKPVTPSRSVLERSTTARRVETLKRVSGEAIAKYLASGKLRGAVFDEGFFWCYTGKHWEAISDDEIGRLVQDLDGMEYVINTGKTAEILRQLASAIGSDGDSKSGAALSQLDQLLGEKKNTLGISNSKVEDVLKLLRRRLKHEGFFADAEIGVNLANGFFTCDPRTGKPTRHDHSADHRQRHLLPGAWTEASGAEKPIRDVLMVNFLGDPDAEQKIDAIGEGIAAGMLGLGGRRNSRMIVLVGDSDSGKSTLLDIISGALRPETRTAMPPEEWANGNSRHGMVGKAVNLVAELSRGKPIPANWLKMVSTGDTVPIKKLYLDLGNARIRAQHFFAANPTAMPTIEGGMGREIQKRFLVIEFNRTIPADERDDQVEFIGDKHPDAFAAFVIEGACRYIAQGGFTEPASARAAMDNWANNDTALEWLAERIIVPGLVPDVIEDGEDRTAARPQLYTKQMFQDFEVWHLAEKMRPPSMNSDTFGKRVASALKDKKGVEKMNNGGRGYYGVQVREPTKDMETILVDRVQMEILREQRFHAR
jgi:energy-coupling factor transporter ATP-binding protein EcfA2